MTPTLSCALRNTGSGWGLISNATHTPTGVTGVTTSSTYLEIAHSVGAVAVSSFQITPDETFASQGLRVGASVGLNSTRIYLYTGCTCDGPTDPVNPATVVAASGNLWISGWLET